MSLMPIEKAPAFFKERDGVFVGNDPARGPWSADHCHAGPVTGLVVRAAEGAVSPGKVLTRLTIDVLRPVPVAGIRVTAEVVRETRTLATTRVQVEALDGTVCVTGSSMHLTRKDLGDVPSAPVVPLRLDEAEPGPPLLTGQLHDRSCFSQFHEVRYPPGVGRVPGPKTVWMKVPPLLEGEDPSPIQSICALADCGNGISWNAPLQEMGFMNTDLTLQIHREPLPGWHASEAVSHWQPNGVGMSQAILHDIDGPVGVALQTLVLHPPR